jgi:hypothetical protein
MQNNQVGMVGQAPAAKIEPIKEELTEVEKYTRMWDIDEYRTVAPGELAANTFLELAKPEAGAKVIDFGCGTGRGSLFMLGLGGLNVTMLDFAENCLDDELVTACKKRPDDIRFIKHDLTEKPNLHAEYGYCTDVMEHIPTDQVDQVLENILNTAEKVFFRISTRPDVMGPRHMGMHLHLTVENYAWWANKFIQHSVVILHSEQLDGALDFYVTGWSNKLPDGKVNVDHDLLLENIRKNSEWPCNDIRAGEIQPDAEIMILCGGPSLNDFEDEIMENYKNGMKVVTMNGSYQWAQQHDIHRVNQCMIDARAFNRRFIEPPRDDCYYFISTQCDPSVFEALPHERTFFWHVTTHPDAVNLTAELYKDHLFCTGGSTVATRTIILMRILGFRKMHVYGMDSCLMGDEHHAYEQKENEGGHAAIPMIIGDKTFQCEPWMAYQAHDFMNLIKKFGDEFQLDVKGDGLIAHILKSGAALPDIEED